MGFVEKSERNPILNLGFDQSIQPQWHYESIDCKKPNRMNAFTSVYKETMFLFLFADIT